MRSMKRAKIYLFRDLSVNTFFFLRGIRYLWVFRIVGILHYNWVQPIVARWWSEAFVPHVIYDTSAEL